MKTRHFSLCFLLSAFCILHSGFLLAAPVEATVESVSGKAEYALPGETVFKTLKADQKLPVGATVRTGKNGTAVIVTMPGAAIQVEGNSRLTLSELDFAKDGDKVKSRKAMIDLQSGTVSALISKNDPQTTDFRIKTPQGIAAARGTFYAVTVEGDKAHVAVKEGKVGIQKAAEQGAAR